MRNDITHCWGHVLSTWMCWFCARSQGVWNTCVHARLSNLFGCYTCWSYFKWVCFNYIGQQQNLNSDCNKCPQKYFLCWFQKCYCFFCSTSSFWDICIFWLTATWPTTGLWTTKGSIVLHCDVTKNNNWCSRHTICESKASLPTLIEWFKSKNLFYWATYWYLCLHRQFKTINLHCTFR